MSKAQQHPGTPLPGIGAPATRALEGIGVTTVEQLAQFTEKELLALHGVGPKAIRLLRPVMEDKGVTFRDDGTSISRPQR
jgi:predicted flap endonuclease-1-like 5' DNA nuclease